MRRILMSACALAAFTVPAAVRAETGAVAGADVAAMENEPAATAVLSLGTVVVVGDRVRRELGEVEGAKIYAGKRTSVALLSDLPPIEGAGYRQAFIEIPGVLISEVSNGSWQSISYRGLGEPHESWNILTLKDGLPVSPDAYAYPAAYYTPPMDLVERIEFLRGGSGLLYGPQPGGAINYVLRQPSREVDGAGGFAKVTVGSNGLSSGLVAFDARRGNWSLSGYGRESQSDGVRRLNADADQASASVRLAYASPTWALAAALDVYDAEFGEPGGLSLARFQADRRAGSTSLDRVAISRTVPSLRLDADLGGWTLEATLAHSAYERTSRRQAGGSFGQVTPGANVAVRQIQEFDVTIGDLRLRRDFEAFGSLQSATAGVSWQSSDAPVRVDKGASPTDWAGSAGALSRVSRTGEALAAFGEVRFGFGRLLVTPGLRVERIEQSVREALDLATGSATGGPPGAANGPLGARSDEETVVLPALGLEWRFSDRTRAILNISRGFKPRLYNDGVSFGAGIDVAGTFLPSYADTIELALKSRPAPWLALEGALFRVTLDDQVGFLVGPLPAAPPFGAVGAGGARRLNVGSMENSGLDLAAAVALFGPDGGLFGRTDWTLRAQANAQFLDAEFTSGPARGFAPQYAPETLVRASLTWTGSKGHKAALFHTAVSGQNGADNPSTDFRIPAYAVWDASIEIPFGDRIVLSGQIKNLFDEAYVARIRPGGGGGIDPGAPRNASLSLAWRF